MRLQAPVMLGTIPHKYAQRQFMKEPYPEDTPAVIPPDLTSSFPNFPKPRVVPDNKGMHCIEYVAKDGSNRRIVYDDDDDDEDDEHEHES